MLAIQVRAVQSRMTGRWQQRVESKVNEGKEVSAMRRTLTLLGLSIVMLVTALGVGPAEAASCGEGKLLWSGDWDLWGLKVSNDYYWEVELNGPRGTNFDLYLYNYCTPVYDKRGRLQGYTLPCWDLEELSTGSGSYEWLEFFAWKGPRGSTGVYFALVVSVKGSGRYTICLE